MTDWCTWFDILWKWAHTLTKFAGDDNTGWPGFMRSEIFLQMKFIIFQDFPTKQAAFLPRQPAIYNHLLIQPLLLVPEYYLA